jgi:hypothetical protein
MSVLLAASVSSLKMPPLEGQFLCLGHVCPFWFSEGRRRNFLLQTRCNFCYCDVFGRMPSLLGNRKLTTSMDTLTTRYCRVEWLPSNRDGMVTWIRSPLGIVALHGCLATVVECFHWDSPML